MHAAQDKLDTLCDVLPAVVAALAQAAEGRAATVASLRLTSLLLRRGPPGGADDAAPAGAAAGLEEGGAAPGGLLGGEPTVRLIAWIVRKVRIRQARCSSSSATTACRLCDWRCVDVRLLSRQVPVCAHGALRLVDPLPGLRALSAALATHQVGRRLMSPRNAPLQTRLRL